jgi:NAD(P)-dependent dehydrogenase (short-subunit alcohol dehydrogenase family)
MKTYFIAGGASGTGKQLVQNILDEGNEVYATYHITPPWTAGNLHWQEIDFRNPAVTPTFPEKIDGLVYCPGSISLKPFARSTDEDFRSDFELQVLGAIRLIRSALPSLKRSEKASIVMFSTVAVQMGFPFHSLVSVSKGAVEGLTKALSAELAPTIRVNCIAPSLTNTPLAGTLLNTTEKVAANDARHPLKRIGTANDIATMAEFLLSEKSSWMTGQVLHVDGGMSSIKL